MNEKDPQALTKEAFQGRLAGAMARAILDEQGELGAETATAVRDCVAAMLAARQMFAVAKYDLEHRLEAVPEAARQKLFRAVVEAMAEGDFLDSRIERWFPTEPGIPRGSQVSAGEKPLYEETAEVYEEDPEKGRHFLSSRLREILQELDPAEVWSLLHPILESSAGHAAGQDFSHETLLTGLQETVLPWLLAVTREHTELQDQAQKQEIEEAERARRERPIPFGIRWADLPAVDPEVGQREWELPRDRPLVLVGWSPALYWLVRRILTTVLLEDEDPCTVFHLRRSEETVGNDLLRLMRRKPVSYYHWMNAPNWVDCGSTRDRWPKLLPHMRGYRSAPSRVDLLICDDLVLAGKSTIPGVGNWLLRAGQSQKRLFAWCREVGAAMIGLYPVRAGEMISSEALSSPEWRQLRDHTHLRAVTVQPVEDRYRVTVGNNLWNREIPKTLLDSLAEEKENA